MERHYNALHRSKFDGDFPLKSDIRKHKLKQLKSKLAAQQQLLAKPSSHSNNATISSFKVSNLIVKNCKPFTEGEFVKECFLEIADNLFEGFKNKKEITAAIQNLQLSRNTVVRRMEKMCKNISEQLLKDVSDCVAFSLQLDESTDNSDTAQILVFIRMVFEDFNTKEELLGMVSLKGRTTGQEIFNYFYSFIKKLNVPLHNLVAITTDGAKAMTGQVNGFIALCRQHDDFPDFLAYHCIIHQQVLASKRLNTKNVMDIAFKIVNSIRGKSLQRRLFNLTLVEGQPDVILHTDVRWLSRHKFLARFRSLLREIISFLKDRGDEYAQLEDAEWLFDLAFLADFTGELSDMNLELQGKGKCIGEMMSIVSSYKTKFKLMKTDLTINTFDHFPNMQDHLEKNPDFVFQTEKYVSEIDSVIQEFERRFGDFQKIESIVEYMSFPFKSDLDIKEIAVTISENYSLSKLSLESEILTLKNDIFLKARATEESFWKFVPRQKFPNLRRCSEILHSCFGSTYLCESAFSYLKMTKSKQRSNMTDEHLQDSLKLALTQYSPDIQQMVNEMQTQASH